MKRKRFKSPFSFATAGEKPARRCGWLADVFDGPHAGIFDAAARGFDQVGGQKIEDLFQRFVEFEFLLAVGVVPVHVLVG